MYKLRQFCVELILIVLLQNVGKTLEWKDLPLFINKQTNLPGALFQCIKFQQPIMWN